MCRFIIMCNFELFCQIKILNIKKKNDNIFGWKMRKWGFVSLTKPECVSNSHSILSSQFNRLSFGVTVHCQGAIATSLPFCDYQALPHTPLPRTIQKTFMKEQEETEGDRSYMRIRVQRKNLLQGHFCSKWCSVFDVFQFPLWTFKEKIRTKGDKLLINM